MNIEEFIKGFLLWDRNDSIALLPIRTILKSLILKCDLSNKVRYDLVLHHIRKQKLSNPKMLEVGSGSVGITRYLKKTVFGIDLNFDGPKLPYLIPIKSSAVSFPFKKDQFDLVFSVDMIEHIPVNLRQAVIAEMLRVSKEWVIIGVPCGQTAVLWEKRAWKFWQEKIKRCKNYNSKKRVLRRGNFLKEHHQNGLPTKMEITQIIEKNSELPVKIEILPNQSVIVWYVLALASFRFNRVVWLVSIVISNLLSPLLRRIMWGGHYREFFIIRKNTFRVD